MDYEYMSIGVNQSSNHTIRHRPNGTQWVNQNRVTFIISFTYSRYKKTILGLIQQFFQAENHRRSLIIWNEPERAGRINIKCCFGFIDSKSFQGISKFALFQN